MSKSKGVPSFGFVMRRRQFYASDGCKAQFYHHRVYPTADIYCRSADRVQVANKFGFCRTDFSLFCLNLSRYNYILTSAAYLEHSCRYSQIRSIDSYFFTGSTGMELASRWLGSIIVILVRCRYGA